MITIDFLVMATAAGTVAVLASRTWRRRREAHRQVLLEEGRRTGQTGLGPVGEDVIAPREQLRHG